MLRAIGATYVVDSTDPDFRERLKTAIEAALVGKAPPRGPYGSPVHKELYIYGRLDRSATTTPPSVGMAWGMGGWLLPYHLTRIGPEETQRLRDRIAHEITTTFAGA